jgi:hypothetical protein
MGIVCRARRVYCLETGSPLLGRSVTHPFGNSQPRNILEYFQENDSENKTADMGPPGDTTARGRGAGRADELEYEPYADEEKGRELNKIASGKAKDMRP